MNRKGIVVDNATDIPTKVPDVLGFRLIAANEDELAELHKIVGKAFEVISLRDQSHKPGEFGERGMEFALCYHVGGEAFPFELQLRTFFQHSFASESFHLFHKKPRETALEHKDALLSLSNSLAEADRVAVSIGWRNTSDSTPVWMGLPIRKQVHIVVVEPGERFATHDVVSISGEDEADHRAIVDKKLALYVNWPGSAIVECSCLQISNYFFNEPHVHLGLDRIDRVHW